MKAGRAMVVATNARLLVTTLVLGAGLAHPAAGRTVPGSSAGGEHPFRVAFSAGFLSKASPADAAASINAWQEAILKPAGIPFDPHPLVYEQIDDARTALAAGLVDAVALGYPDYFELTPDLLESDSVFVSQRSDGFTDRYVVIVSKDAGITSLDQIRDAGLLVWDHQRNSLALMWLGLLLAEGGRTVEETFSRGVIQEPKLNKVALPVFFGQADACLIPESGFQNIVELNPQVGARLTVLATSPEFVSSLLTFRAGYESPYREQVEEAIGGLHTSVAGKQVLTIFGCNMMVRASAGCLDQSSALIQDWERHEQEKR